MHPHKIQYPMKNQNENNENQLSPEKNVALFTTKTYKQLCIS